MSNQLRTESTRERESYRYAPDLLSNAIINNSGQPLPNSSLSTSHDTVLTALAQLGACQTKTARSLISIFDEKYQYVIAEATPTLSLAPSLSHTQRDEELWLCGSAIPRDHGICECALLEPDAVQTESHGKVMELPLTQTNDINTDPRFHSKSFCQPVTRARAYAAVPIKTRRGINIGVYCVLDPAPFEYWTEKETQILRNISRTITQHLESERARYHHRRSTRMNQGIGSLIQQKATIVQSPGTDDEVYRGSLSGEGALNANQQSFQYEFGGLREPFKGEGSMSSGHGAAVDGCVPEQPASARPSYSASRTSNNAIPPHGKVARLVFSKAANLIREAIEVEGCLFLDAATQVFGGLTSPSMDGQGPQNTEEAGSSTSGLSSSDEDQMAVSSNQPCQVLGFSTSQKSSIDGATTPASNSTMSEKLLARMLRRYPHGKILAFSSTGELQSSDSSEEDRDSLACLSKREGDVPRQRKKPNPKSQELETLRRLFPGARSIAFVPVWNSKRNRWYAGGFVYTNAIARQFSVEDDLNYLKAFGILAVNEVFRHDMMEDEKSKSDALGSISHELRSPLHGIMLAVECLNDTVQTVLQGDMAHTIETCGRTLLDTLDHLLDFSRINQFASSYKEQRRSQVFHKGVPRTISEGMMSLATSVRLDRLAEDVVETVFSGYNFQRLSVAQISNRSEATHRDVISNRLLDTMQAGSDLSYEKTLAGMMSHAHGNIWVLLDIDPKLNWCFQTQPGAIRRIIMNLFGNALKFTRHGRIKISLKQKPTDATYRGRDRIAIISVSDTGSGIGRDLLQNDLFKPFTQEDSLRPGTGIGLSLVKQIASQLRGRINIDSRPGIGTTVTVTLPLKEPPSASFSSMDVDDHQVFKERVSKLQGLRVRLLSGPSTELSDVYTLTESICKDWLHMEVIPESEARTLSADFILLFEEDLASSDQYDKVLSDTPSVVICKNVITAYQRNKSSTLLKRPVEYISQPVAPRKLARILLLAFDRWEENQHNLSDSIDGWTEDDISSDPPSDSTQPSPLYPDPNGPPDDRHMPRTPASDLVSPVYLQPPPTTRPTIKRSGSSFKLKIPYLLVDDNQINLKMLMAFAKKLGSPYLTATNGAEAVDQYMKQSQDCRCILMDISMPVMDGMEATRQIRTYEREHELSPALIIALTGLASAETQQEAFSSGMDLFLTKPVRMQELKSVITSYSFKEG